MTDLVEVVVRSSSGSSTDVVYQLSAGAKVLELKQKVAERHASHPPPENQRLIFCGRILNNEDVISELGRSLEPGTRLTVILWFRTTPAGTPPPEQIPRPANQFQAQPNMPFPPNQAFGMPPGMAGNYYFAQPQFNPMGGARPMWGGYQGYPGAYGPGAHPAGAFPPQGYGIPPGMQPPQEDRRIQLRARLNLGWMFGALLLALVIFIQGGPNSYFYSALLLLAAFYYLRPRANPQQQAGGNAAGNANGQNAQNNNNNGAGGGGLDNLEQMEEANPANNVPSILRYDWRHHRGVVGEILGFFCPLVFSLWPSWDPSVLGDHPDVIRRRREEEEAAARRQAEGGAQNGMAQPAAQPEPAPQPVDANQR